MGRCQEFSGDEEPKLPGCIPLLGAGTPKSLVDCILPCGVCDPCMNLDISQHKDAHRIVFCMFPFTRLTQRKYMCTFAKKKKLNIKIEISLVTITIFFLYSLFSCAVFSEIFYFLLFFVLKSLPEVSSFSSCFIVPQLSETNKVTNHKYL